MNRLDAKNKWKQLIGSKVIYQLSMMTIFSWTFNIFSGEWKIFKNSRGISNQVILIGR